MGEGDGAIALHAIDLHQHASGALINVDKSVIVPLNSSAVPAEFLTLPFSWKAYGEPFVHLEVDNASGGCAMATIETEFLQKLQRQVNEWNTLNIYLLSKLWYVGPFYASTHSSAGDRHPVPPLWQA
ncbi:hypothetical protein BG003_007961 [Podila horticola]|nr:hypothetical protein BG003_007961 [Podila horticola]